MMRMAVVALLLLLLNSLQETEAADSPKPLKPSDELKQLRDIIYQQGIALAELKTEMKYIEKENADLKTKLVKQTKQSKQVQKTMETLRKEVSAQAEDVSSTKTRLAASESQVENLKEENAEIKTALAARESDVNSLKKDNAVLKGRLSTSEGDVQNLKKEIIEQPKVAFSAALGKSVNPPSADTNLVYPTVITNVGGAYNPNTGIFTSPFRGVYYFRYSVCASTESKYSGIYLYKNTNQISFLPTYNYNGYARFISGGYTLELEIGDTVYTRIPKGYTLYESGNKMNTFSGFMLFAM